MENSIKEIYNWEISRIIKYFYITIFELFKKFIALYFIIAYYYFLIYIFEKYLNTYNILCLFEKKNIFLIYLKYSSSNINFIWFN